MGEAAPSDVLRVVNEAVGREPGESRLCTVAYARIRLDGDVLTVDAASAGHPLPLVVRAGGPVEALGEPGTLLGAFSVIDVSDATTTLLPGDALVLHTDGVTEARKGTAFFGGERVERLLSACASCTAEELVDRLVDAVLEFQGDVPRDDIAVVAVRVPAP